MFAHHDSELARSFAGCLGLENELVVLTRDGNLVRDIRPLLHHIWNTASDELKELVVGEFQRWQLELKTRPYPTFQQAMDEFVKILNIARQCADDLGFRLEAIEYLDTDEKFGFGGVSTLHPAYMAYARANQHKVEAMCRVASLQINIGMGSFAQSLRAHNRLLAPDVMNYILENWADPRRVQLFDDTIFPGYKSYAPVRSGEELIRRIQDYGYLHEPGRFYPPDRLHHDHPTNEERRLGATTDVDRIREMFAYSWSHCYPGIAAPMTTADLVADRRILLAA